MDRDTFFASLKPTVAGCLEWQRGRTSKGYGMVRFEGQDVRSHRLAFRLAFGTFADRLGLQVLHKCDNPPCCNPQHLWAGTGRENQQDKVSKGRHAPQHGSKNNHARLTEEQVRDVIARCERGQLQREVAAAYGISQPSVSKIVNRATWRHI